MAQKTIILKGYHGTIEVDTTDYSLYGKILFIDEEISYQGETFAEFEENFQKVVEDHIQHCLIEGRTPPFSD